MLGFVWMGFPISHHSCIISPLLGLILCKGTEDRRVIALLTENTTVFLKRSKCLRNDKGKQQLNITYCSCPFNRTELEMLLKYFDRYFVRYKRQRVAMCFHLTLKWNSHLSTSHSDLERRFHCNEWNSIEGTELT